jgi:hypothetical protein
VTAQIAQERDLVLPCTPWVIKGDGERIEPQPGTWTLAPEKFLRQGVKGILSCPACNTCALVPFTMGSDVQGTRLLPRFQCAHCKLVANLKLQEWDRRKLWCTAYEITSGPGEGLHKEYTHAENREEVMYAFLQTRKLPRYRLVDVGQVVGYFGHEKDKNQTELTV